MSINRSDSLQNGGEYIFRDYSVTEGSDYSLSEQNAMRRAEQSFNDLSNFNLYSWKRGYSIPLNVVKSNFFSVHKNIQNLYETIEDLLNKVYLNPYLDPDIEESHFHLWEELYKNNNDVINQNLANIKEDDQGIFTGGSKYFDENTGTYKDKEINSSNPVAPNFISFNQYIYAEEHGCRGCRKFVKEYDRLISHSVFVHLFDFRYYLKLLLNESDYIKESLLYDFGDEYNDESQEQTATFYFSWAKMAENHTRLIAEELAEQATQLPNTEVDNISEKQAAQFQAFFSIRVASYTEVIDNLLFSLKKDLMDTCDIFYKRFVSPSLKFKAQVAAPLELDIKTTSLTNKAPILSEEIITAVNSVTGNFGAVLTDMVQRKQSINTKFDKLFSLNIQRRKYINYIDQLSVKGSSRPKVILNISEDKYSPIFDLIYVDPSERKSLKSTHASLDDLSEDHHPQYLMRSGGTIFGDILVSEGITIDGVDISEHAHTGLDGSAKIKSTDIDYDTVREEVTLFSEENGTTLALSITNFSSDIRQGGIPVVDAILEINIPDDIQNKYELEILYVEN